MGLMDQRFEEPPLSQAFQCHREEGKREEELME